MSFVNKMLAAEAWISVHLNTLDTDVEIKKLTVREGAQFDKKIKSAGLDKNPEKIADVVHAAGQTFIRDEDGMIFADTEIDVVRDMPVDVCAEIMRKFREVNRIIDESELEKN